MSYPEEHLVLRLKQRDAQAMREIYDRFGRLVYSVVYHSVREPAMSQDLSQETFIRVWNRIQTFDPERGSLESWIVAIARNRATDYLRSLRGKRALTLIDVNVQLLSVASPALRIEREDLTVIALRNLNHAQRQIIHLVYFRGLTLLESAQILQRPLASVKSVVRGALKVLRRATDGPNGNRCSPGRTTKAKLTGRPVLAAGGQGPRK